MKHVLAAIVACGLWAVAPLAAAQNTDSEPPDSAWTRYPGATSIRVEDAAARVRVAPQVRGDSAYVIVNPGPLPDPVVRVRGDRLIIDGRLERLIQGCADDGSITVRGYGALTAAQLPVIYVRTPAALVFEGNGGLMVEAGPSTSARIGLAGCGVGRIGAVTDQLSLSLAGGTAALTGPSARARVAIAGDGYAVLGPVARALEVAIAGDGYVRTGAVSGPVRVAIQGDGFVDLGAGRVESLRVAIAGSGHVRFAGDAETVSAAIAGSGLVEVAHAHGAVEQRVAGSGAVRIGPLPPSPPPPPPPPPNLILP